MPELLVLRHNCIYFQGTIYSETAAANYPDKDMFEKAKSAIPVKRLGTTEEVKKLKWEETSAFFALLF